MIIKVKSHFTRKTLINNITTIINVITEVIEMIILIEIQKIMQVEN